MSAPPSRRGFLEVSIAVAGAAALGSPGRAEAAEAKKAPDVTPTEDLMREHGVLRRVLLIYEEAVRRLSASPPAGAISSAAGIIRDFVQRYHEHLEETQVFPRLQKAGRQGDLVRVLLEQHAAGRAVTARILENATPKALADPAKQKAVAADIGAFIRMYRPHAAREDTVLFPAFRELFTDRELDRLGDQFEEQEKKLLGAGGFEGALLEVEAIEKDLGIADLAQLTPR